jgi:hypothetical protein
MHAVFAPNSPETATALEYTTRAALQRWLGDVIHVQSLAFRADDARLQVELQYVVRETGEARAATFDVAGAT